MAAGLVDEHGRLLHHFQVPTLAKESRDAYWPRHFGDGEGSSSATERPVRFCGVASARGTVGPTGQILAAITLLRDWAGADVRGYLRNALDLTVTIGNDVHPQPVGRGSGCTSPGTRTGLMMAIVMGIGGALVVDAS